MDLVTLALAKSRLGVLSVMDFGAKGDNSTDDTNSIQAAIDTAESAGGGMVVFPPNKTFIVTGLKLGNGVGLSGGGYSTVIKLKNGVNDSEGRDVVQNKDEQNGNTGILIQNLRVHGNRSGQSGHRGNAIGLWNCQSCIIANVWAHDAGPSQNSRGSGIYVSGGKDIHIYAVHTYSNSRHGIGTTSGPENVTISDFRTTANGLEGIHTSTGNAITISNGVARGNATIGIMTQNAQRCLVSNCVAWANGWEGFGSSSGHTLFTNCYAYENTRDGFNLAATGGAISRCTITGGASIGNGRSGIRITKASRVSIVGVVVESNGVDYDALLVEELPAAPHTPGIITISGSIFEAVGTGKSINFPDAGFDQLNIQGNITPQGISIAGTPTQSIIHGNLGHATENRGTVSITGDGSTVTNVQVAHGLAAAPTSVVVTPMSDLGSAEKFWVDSIDDTTFTLNVNADPGNEVEITFSWQANCH